MESRIKKFKQFMADNGMSDLPQSLINGKLVHGHGEVTVLADPYTGQPLTSFADADEPLANQACLSAQSAQRVWMNDFSAAGRGAVMQNIAREIGQAIESLARLESIVAGKPIRDCRIEMSKVQEMFAYYAGWADKLHGEVIPVPSGHLNFTKREPLGVVFQITPWNAPAFTAGWQIAPAIATGNGVVIKPSEFTPVTTVAITILAEKAGLPVGLVNVLCGLGETAGQAAIAHNAVRKVIFVGSPKTGRLVAIAAANALKPAVLELGGKSANIVFDDANLTHACLGAQAAIFSSAGQSCVAGSRLLIQRSVHDEMLEMLQLGMNKIVLGDPLDEDTEVGPLGNQRQFEHVSSMVKIAKTDGAKVSCRDTRPEYGFFMPPTILSGLTNEASSAQEEVFGPVVSLIPFRTEEEAITIANDTNFGLAGAVWTSDVGRAHRVAEHVRAGTFWINSYKAIHVSSPFGGSLNSGFGRSSGTDALMEYTAAKSIWIDSAPIPKIAFGYVS